AGGNTAGRSPVAAAFPRAPGAGQTEAPSAGSAPAETLTPNAVDAMKAPDIDITRKSPTLLDADTVRTSDVVITMGCGDTCPIFPGKRYEDWDLDDPAGQNLESVRRIRDDIRGRVEALISDLVPDTEAQPGTSTTETPQPTEEALHE